MWELWKKRGGRACAKALWLEGACVVVRLKGHYGWNSENKWVGDMEWRFKRLGVVGDKLCQPCSLGSRILSSEQREATERFQVARAP